MNDTKADEAVMEAIREQIANDDYGGSSFLHDCGRESTLPWPEHDSWCRGRCYAAVSGESDGS